jgi:hypothetical protein
MFGWSTTKDRPLPTDKKRRGDGQVTQAGRALAAVGCVMAGACGQPAEAPAEAVRLECEAAASPSDPRQSAFLDALCGEVRRLLGNQARSSMAPGLDAAAGAGAPRWVRLEVEFVGPRALRSSLSWGMLESDSAEVLGRGGTLTTAVSDGELTASVARSLAADLIETSSGVAE